ncbi:MULTISPECIES: sugar phosphate isomerase/epimerase [unclassified Lactococcus]|uniref:sugar phosphate isomerase/epimerase family protein n=1 Tax=unclassified Lactococcus TaxID=2643510 RepID=UPI0011CB23E9|nr:MULTISPECIES: TIM barrel protein [unclassified Lactococcus]MQW22993.1 TIM barrel protein [Lactococcus sp. dk101]TXK44339.1 TIM barrel protein [Lactococcus sp. dk310]TXK50148.1 TIM barrel protein [Lactococcus sp. dk322]
MKKQIVANLLIFEGEWKSGIKQSQLIREAAALGFETVEIRREYFFDIQSEILEINSAVSETQVELYYSVPDKVFIDGEINPELVHYLDEALAMGVKKIKWNIGDFANFKGNLSDALTPLINYGIEINVENDQSEENGTIQPIQRFLKAIRADKIDLGFVFDIGNWSFVGESAQEAMILFIDDIRYIHLKDIVIQDGKVDVVGIDCGTLAWREILFKVSKEIPIALEYPTFNHEIIEEDMTKVCSYLETELWRK